MAPLMQAEHEGVSGRLRRVRRLQIQPEVQAQRTLLTKRDADLPDLATLNECDLAEVAARSHDPHVRGRAVGHQHRAWHVVAAHPERRLLKCRRLGGLLVGHAAQISGRTQARVGSALLTVRCSGVETGSAAEIARGQAHG